jgi:hypothetical protein
MAETEDSPDSVDNPYGGQDFFDSGPPLTEELLARIKKLIDEAGGDSDEALAELLQQKLGTLPKPVEPVQPLLTSQFFVLLTFLLLIASMSGKKFVLVLNITSSIHCSDFCFL